MISVPGNGRGRYLDLVVVVVMVVVGWLLHVPAPCWLISAGVSQKHSMITLPANVGIT